MCNFLHHHPRQCHCGFVQVEDAFYFLPNPFPEDKLVGVVKQTLGLVDSSTRQVPLSEVPIRDPCCCLRKR